MAPIDDRDTRERMIRLEVQMQNAQTELADIKRKIWAVIGLVLLAVGKQLIAMIGLST